MKIAPRVSPCGLRKEIGRDDRNGRQPGIGEDFGEIDQVMLLDDPRWLDSRNLNLPEGRLRVARYDGAAKLNGEELEFARALDRAGFVARRHRNPDKKDYSVRLVRADHHYCFHPDFVLCVEHYHGAEPSARLIETKENLKDPARKSRRVPKSCGKVLFLTKDQNGLRVINEDGGLGMVVNWDDLAPLGEWLRETQSLG
jgi:hypothetical protein